KESKKEPEQREPSILEKLALAHGYESWETIKELRFTFNVDRDSTHFERSWIWQPKTNEVTSISRTDTITYIRRDMDSISHGINKDFINDKYWLLAPINILWDNPNLEVEHLENVIAPISKEPMQKLSVVYGNEGGYTPGDAYDFYFGDDFLIKEWVFRKGNRPEPSMTTTWEDYTDIKGLQIALTHQKDDGSLVLYFSNVSAETEP
ncbi:MAG: hypothetical protein AAGA86_06370, partial [Bacteroidota bacterium]